MSDPSIPFHHTNTRHRMIRINDNYLKLQASYLFSDIAKRVAAFQEANPDRDVITWYGIQSCGDGVTNGTSGEICDDGAATASCDADCTPAVCGDGNSKLAALPCNALVKE